MLVGPSARSGNSEIRWLLSRRTCFEMVMLVLGSGFAAYARREGSDAQFAWAARMAGVELELEVQEHLASPHLDAIQRFRAFVPPTSVHDPSSTPVALSDARPRSPSY